MNMATIKAIEARSVHQIQSGQVIVDLCSVAKELVENSVDAGATSIEVRFKNNGLDLIEVQDNGSGISPDNYENVALKHYTSKLSSFDDLSRLHTFGFRGEALSSLCALADFHAVTAQAHTAPKATRLEFEPSGKLKKTAVVAGQKGTTCSAEGIFKRLPVRRRELEKNIKREYGKVLNLLHAYACVMTGVRISVKNSVGKNKNVLVFSTKGNASTKENIANVYGAKTLLALIPLDLELEFEPSASGRKINKDGNEANKIFVRGHVSRPVFGEGRQTPDRQMFFVNSRPCALPQIAKAFNEVYKSFNVSQSPFVFADFHMDTNAYDVNVSPDKRTVLLHDAGALIESLKASLTQLFESADQTVPQSQVHVQRSISSMTPARGVDSTPGRVADSGRRGPEREQEDEKEEEEEEEQSQISTQNQVRSFMNLDSRTDQPSSPVAKTSDLPDPVSSPAIRTKQARPTSPDEDNELFVSEADSDREEPPVEKSPLKPETHIDDENEEEDSSQGNIPESSAPEVEDTEETPNAIQNAFDRMRPRRAPAELATITIGDKTITSMIGSGAPRKRDSGAVGASSGQSSRKRRIHTPSRPNLFGRSIRDFAAPGSQMARDARGQDEGDDEEVEEEEEGGEQEVQEDDEEEGEEEEAEDEPAEEGSEIESDEPEERDQDGDQDGDQPMENESPDEYAPEDKSDVSYEDAPPSTEKPMDEEEKKKHEEAEVQRLIREAEEKAVGSEESNIHRANKMNKGAAHRDATVQLMSTLDGSLSRIETQMQKLQASMQLHAKATQRPNEDATTAAPGESSEERLSLTVTKDDFAQMRIIGQFNLGFILATRSTDDKTTSQAAHRHEDLFIIDQHASDEKCNFERLQAETVVQNQRLVQPKTLELTAVEEEIVIENQSALEKNGFVVDVDLSGDEPIGRRCKLVSLPLSKEVVFDLRDLEELLVLLSETPAGTQGNMDIPRPSKVRKMFAMRACRSSIMIGKTLTAKQMGRVVRNMGRIDKPWNCPHGRPTMRHLMSLGEWEEWEEDEGQDGLDVWREYLAETLE